MTKTDTHTREQMHRGSFADGQTSPDRYPDNLEVRSFAEGEADPAGYPEDDRVGTFALGQRGQPRTPPIYTKGRLPKRMAVSSVDVPASSRRPAHANLATTDTARRSLVDDDRSALAQPRLSDRPSRNDHRDRNSSGLFVAGGRARAHPRGIDPLPMCSS